MKAYMSSDMCMLKNIFETMCTKNKRIKPKDELILEQLRNHAYHQSKKIEKAIQTIKDELYNPSDVDEKTIQSLEEYFYSDKTGDYA